MVYRNKDTGTASVSEAHAQPSRDSFLLTQAVRFCIAPDAEDQRNLPHKPLQQTDDGSFPQEEAAGKHQPQICQGNEGLTFVIACTCRRFFPAKVSHVCSTLTQCVTLQTWKQEQLREAAKQQL